MKNHYKTTTEKTKEKNRTRAAKYRQKKSQEKRIIGDILNRVLSVLKTEVENVSSVLSLREGDMPIIGSKMTPVPLNLMGKRLKCGDTIAPNGSYPLDGYIMKGKNFTDEALKKHLQYGNTDFLPPVKLARQYAEQAANDGDSSYLTAINDINAKFRNAIGEANREGLFDAPAKKRAYTAIWCDCYRLCYALGLMENH